MSYARRFASEYALSFCVVFIVLASIGVVMVNHSYAAYRQAHALQFSTAISDPEAAGDIADNEAPTLRLAQH